MGRLLEAIAVHTQLVECRMLRSPENRSPDARADRDASPAREGLKLEASPASPVLARLIEEVRNDDSPARAYDRVHRRHNRS
jgi:hypothetical protein